MAVMKYWDEGSLTWVSLDSTNASHANTATTATNAGYANNAGTVNNKTVLTSVPSGAKFTDTIYTHPSHHPASIITQTSSYRFVTDAEKSAWNGKASGSHNHNTLYLGRTAKAVSSANSDKLNGRKYTVSTTAPTSPSTNDVWIEV